MFFLVKNDETESPVDINFLFFFKFYLSFNIEFYTQFKLTNNVYYL